MSDIKHIQNSKEAPYLNWIEQGVKTYEGRLATKIEEWDLHYGKVLIFSDGTKTVHTKVTSLLMFKDFGEAYDCLGEKLIPGSPFEEKSIRREEVIKMYSVFYNQEEILLHGVVAIGIEVLPQNI